MKTPHPRLKVKEPRSGRSEHRHAARLKCGLSLRLAKKNALSTHKCSDKTLMRIPRWPCRCSGQTLHSIKRTHTKCFVRAKTFGIHSRKRVGFRVGARLSASLDPGHTCRKVATNSHIFCFRMLDRVRCFSSVYIEHPILRIGCACGQKHPRHMQFSTYAVLHNPLPCHTIRYASVASCGSCHYTLESPSAAQR